MTTPRKRRKKTITLLHLLESLSKTNGAETVYVRGVDGKVHVLKGTWQYSAEARGWSIVLDAEECPKATADMAQRNQW